MKKIIILLSVFVLMIVATGHAQGYQQVYNHLNQICHTHLGRGDLPELPGWAIQIVTGQTKMEVIVSGIINSEEAKARAADIAAGATAATTDEAAADTTADTAAETTTAAVNPLPPSPAYINIVQQIKYQCLVHLGRVNVDEVPMWADQVLRGNMKLEDVIIGIQNSEEAKARAGDISATGSEESAVEGLGE